MIATRAPKVVGFQAEASPVGFVDTHPLPAESVATHNDVAGQVIVLSSPRPTFNRTRFQVGFAAPGLVVDSTLSPTIATHSLVVGHDTSVKAAYPSRPEFTTVLGA